MLLACKYEEVFVPSVDEFVMITDKAYTKKEVLNMVPIYSLPFDGIHSIVLNIFNSLKYLFLILFFFGTLRRKLWWICYNSTCLYQPRTFSWEDSSKQLKLTKRLVSTTSIRISFSLYARKIINWQLILNETDLARAFGIFHDWVVLGGIWGAQVLAIDAGCSSYIHCPVLSLQV